MVRNLVCCLVILAVVSSVSNAAVLANWKLNEGSGSVAYDSSGNGADIALDYGVGSWIGGSFNFDGTQRFVLDRSVTTFFDMSKDFTFSATINASPAGGTQCIFSTNDGENYYLGSRNFGIYNGKLYFEAAGIAGMYNGNISVLDGRMHNVEVEFYAATGTIKTFVDGSPDNQSSAFGGMAETPDFYTFHIGSNLFIDGYGLYSPFVGTMSNVVITPEPVTMAMLGLGALGLLRKRSKV
ncbi:MAG: hypothetical protein A2Y12_13075 [Planctomycetes bacterium GWF2_42_9]|nr:MAG: hypothetical protein A2Y12_13075 [Planctomycetes bacterium GWF2_42_9]